MGNSQELGPLVLFSETPVFLRTSELRPFGTVLKIRSFRVTYELRGKEVQPFPSDMREPPIALEALVPGAHGQDMRPIGSRVGDLHRPMYVFQLVQADTAVVRLNLAGETRKSKEVVFHTGD